MDPGPLRIDPGPLRIDPGPLRIDPGPLRIDPGPLRIDPGPLRIDPGPLRIDPGILKESPLGPCCVRRLRKMTKCWETTLSRRQNSLVKSYLGMKNRTSVLTRPLFQRANASFDGRFSQFWWGRLIGMGMLPLGEYNTTRDPPPGRGPGGSEPRGHPRRPRPSKWRNLWGEGGGADGVQQ